MRRTAMGQIVILFVCLLGAASPVGAEVVRLDTEDEVSVQAVLECFLAPGESSSNTVEYVSRGDEASFSLDSSLGASQPFAELHPERLTWPKIAGLELVVEGDSLRLGPSVPNVTDDDLDAGFTVRWGIVPIGQRFEPRAHFVARVVEAEVVQERTGRRLLYWKEPEPPPVCTADPQPGRPNCDLPGVSHEVRAVAIGPRGDRLALAIGGLRPRLELYDVSQIPRRLWQMFFPQDSGGAVQVAFSVNGEWVVALTGTGAIHRVSARTGGRHMRIPSKGRAARSVPPGEVMAVGGEAGAVTLWYLDDGTIAWRLPPRQVRGAVDRLAVSGDGRRIATLEYDERAAVVRVWEIHRRSVQASITVEPYTIFDVALDEDGSTLYATHDRDGLLAATLDRRTPALEPIGGKDARACRGRLQWIGASRSLSCSVSSGQVVFDGGGKVTVRLATDVLASEWLFAAAVTGRRFAAVGGGRLLVWWRDMPKARSMKLR